MIGDEPERFWEYLVEAARLKSETPMERDLSAAMHDADVQRFERKTFPPYSRIGWLAGKRVLDATTEEIARWLDDDEFTRELRRYAATPRFRERQRAEEAARPEWLSQADPTDQ